MTIALPELTKKQVETTLGSYCEKRVPPHVRNQVRLKFSFDGDSVSLFEERPYFQDPSKWTSTPIAQFRFNTEDKTWTVYYADRNSKWNLFERAKPARQFTHLLKAVENDATGTFWG